MFFLYGRVIPLVSVELFRTETNLCDDKYDKYHCDLFCYKTLSVSITLAFMASLLAHLSQRLICELIGYQWSGDRRRRPSTISNVFSSETLWPTKLNFMWSFLGKGEPRFV